MKDDSNETEKWIFVAGLTLLVAVFAWQLIRPADEQISIPGPTAEQPDRPLPFRYEPADNGLFTLQELMYFNEIAFTSEHRELEPRIRKWTDDIVIRIEGQATPGDRQAVARVVDELNSLQDAVTLRQDVFGANLVIHFQPEHTFHEINQNYRPVNYGFFWARWVNNEIYAATVLIDSSKTSQAGRNALIKEELTQAMGLMDASSSHKDSIFNDEQGEVRAALAPIDRQLLRMLYHPAILPSMTPEEALTVLSQLTAETPDVDQAT